MLFVIYIELCNDFYVVQYFMFVIDSIIIKEVNL